MAMVCGGGGMFMLQIDRCITCNKRLYRILCDTRSDWAESGLYEFWNILLSHSCRNEKIVLLLSDYKSKFFKLVHADYLDLVPDFGDFVSPIRPGFLAIFRARPVKESGPKFVENMLKG